MSWLIENGLALYGAVTGTAALGISYLGYRHNKKRDAIKLAVSLLPHPNQRQNIADMQSTGDKEPWSRMNLTEVFLVTVRNLGSVPAPLEDVGVITDKGEKVHALVHKNLGGGSFLCEVGESCIEALEPKDSRTFSVYLKTEQPLFSVMSVYAKDRTGKTWSSRA